MANYANLKSAIQQVVKTNGNNEITGALLQQSLIAMINALGGYYQFAGIATPSTNPGTPDQNVFYLASTAGTYSNFGSIVIAENEAAILKYNGTWSKDSSGFATSEKVNQLQQNVNGLGDSLGGYDLQLLTGWNAGKYIITNQSQIPHSNGEITMSDNVNYYCLAVPVSPGDTFLLNNVGGSGSAYRAYAWAKSDFTVISHSGNGHTCVYETVVAPANAAWLVLNNNDRVLPLPCYKGHSFKSYVDGRVEVTPDASGEVSTIRVGEQNYIVAAEKTSKRLLDTIQIASGTAGLDTEGGTTQNIINGNYSLKKGSTIKITLTGLGTVVSNIDLYINGSFALRVAESETTYVCGEDVTSLRVLARKANIITNGNVSATIGLLGIYHAISKINVTGPDFDEAILRSAEEDVSKSVLITPKWKNTSLANNAAQEFAEPGYITSDFIPVDTLSLIRISCNYDYKVFRFDRAKARLGNPDSYSGDIVLKYNDRANDYNISYIRICANTNDPANITIYADNLLIPLNNKRFLGNKNIKSFGHRGSSLRNWPYTAADNYPSSIWGAYVNGFEGVHVNVQFTSDGVPYCLHDDTFVDDVSGDTITLTDSTSTEIEDCLRNGQPIAKVESAIYMAKMMGLDVILYNIYGNHSDSDYDTLINMVKKYDMFEHTYFGIASSQSAVYLPKLVAAYPKANIIMTQADISSSSYSQISDLIVAVESVLQSYPNLQIYMWLYSGHSEENFIRANSEKPYNVRLAAFGVTEAQYGSVLPYVSIYTSNIGYWSFGANRRDIEKIVTDKYPEFLLGDYGNTV